MAISLRPILGTDYIGDSRYTINTNFASLSSFVAPDYTAIDINNRQSSVNKPPKQSGMVIYNSTHHCLMVASGSTDTSPWYVATGLSAVTPA